MKPFALSMKSFALFISGGVGVDSSEMERDQFPEAARTAYDDGWHYGLCNWYDCLQTSDWSSECKDARVHSSAGVMGKWSSEWVSVAPSDVICIYYRLSSLIVRPLADSAYCCLTAVLLLHCYCRFQANRRPKIRLLLPDCLKLRLCSIDEPVSGREAPD
jgi:hypothetical protein